MALQQVYAEDDTDSGGQKFGGALLNALVFVGVILVTTVIFVILFKYRCMKAIYGWLCTATVMLLGFFGGLSVYAMLTYYDLPLDWVSLVFLLWNWSISGVISIFWKGPLRLQQVYLVAVSAITAAMLTRLPEWTAWLLLAAVAIYDLFAVLTPKGPLKVLVETAQERKEPIPGLVYTAPDIKLGLGDFIFYSILVARGALTGDAMTVVTTAVAVLSGLSMTLLLLGIFRKALPALPISIALGIVYYFYTRAVIGPYSDEFTMRMAML